VTDGPPDLLPFTGDDEADRLLAREPLALLIGFVLDQQVPLQKAFSGPLGLRRRIGTLEAGQGAPGLSALSRAPFEQARRPRVRPNESTLLGRGPRLRALTQD
jgi:hypothetical protein